MKSFSKMVGSVSFVVAILIGCLGVGGTQTACSAGKTCSSAEEQSCTNTYTTCTTEAASSADTTKCDACVEAYCNCYDSCGNSCDRKQLGGSCASQVHQ